MTFTIRYEKTGREISIDDKKVYLMMNTKDLEKFGFVPDDVFDEDRVIE